MLISDLAKRTTILFFIIMICFDLQANVITVKKDGTGNYQIIQQAVDSAFSGDTILVYPGTYIENIIIEKDLLLASLNLTTGDPEFILQTIIDGNKSGSCLRVYNCQFNVWGFIIQNGSGKLGTGDTRFGGGICSNGADLTIKNCIIQNNKVNFMGGGIYLSGGYLSLSGTSIRNNISLVAAGGIQCSYSFIYFDTINKCNIYLNHAHSYGGSNDLYFNKMRNEINIVVDTFTVKNPDHYFIRSIGDSNSINLQCDHGKIEQVSQDVYVSPQGNNNNSGLSPDEPLKNFWYANAKILVDSLPCSIHLAEGVYSPSLNGERFPVGLRNNIYLEGEGKNKTFFDGDSTTYIFSACKLDTVNIKNMTFRNGLGQQGEYDDSYPGLGEIFLCKKVEIQNTCFTRGYSTWVSALQISAYNYLYFNYVDFINNHENHALRLGQYCIEDSCVTSSKLVNCRFINNTPAHNAIGRGGAIYCRAQQTEPIKQSLYIIGCEFTGNYSKSSYYSGVGASGNTVLFFANCTFGNNTYPSYPISPIVSLGLKSSAKVYNCIFYDTLAYEFELDGHASDMEYELEIHNTLFNNGTNGIFVDDPLASYYYDSTTCIDLNPMWVDTVPYPYYLKSNSPCIDAGTLYLPEEIELPNYDIAGKQRVWGNGIDIGAYEYVDDTGLNPENNIFSNNLKISPNPTSDNCKINYTIIKKGFVSIRILNCCGQICKTVLEYEQNIGEHQISENLKLKSGIYFVCLYNNNMVTGIRKLIIQ